MKCLSICQPWAMLVVLGAKRYETRSWSTRYRGLLAIHASKTFKEEARELCQQEPFRSALLAGGFRTSADLPRGAVIGAVELVDCVSTTQLVEAKLLDNRELAFGNFDPRRFAFACQRPVCLPRPLVMPGKLNLFQIPDLILPVQKSE